LIGAGAGNTRSRQIMSIDKNGEQKEQNELGKHCEECEGVREVSRKE
jgi:hypothetical protein